MNAITLGGCIKSRSSHAGLKTLKMMVITVDEEKKKLANVVSALKILP